MSDGILGSAENPIIIKAPLALKWLALQSIFLNEPSKAEAVRAVTPVILSSVEVGQTFVFFSKPENKLTLFKDEEGKYFILPNPAQLNSAKTYLEIEDMSECAKLKEQDIDVWKIITNPIKSLEDVFKKMSEEK